MTNIAGIDLGRLLPYAEGRRKSFEEFMYQLAYSQYSASALTQGSPLRDYPLNTTYPKIAVGFLYRA